MSQLDAAIHEQQDYFERRFSTKGADVPLPPEYQSLPHLRWTCYAVSDGFRPDEFAEQYAWYKRRTYWTDHDADGEDWLVVQTGYIWVGRAAT
ncbi:MAG: hypothetical protein EOO56_23230 [Hymenobacter sp.]|nr:MAG: hypothetical protein EOO56_23230 [Hymenobacter sp.]